MITGAYLSAAVNGTPIAGTHEWGCNETSDRLEATTGADGGRGRKEVGVIDTKIKIRFYLDIVAGRMGFIRTGTQLTNLQLYLDDQAPTPLYAISEARVFDTNVVGQVRDKWVVDADIEAVGNVVEFTDPA